MRIFELSDNWKHENEREVIKRGKWVHTQRMQDIDTDGDDKYNTKEILNYSFMLKDVANLDAVRASMPDCDFRWADAEFMERIAQQEINPGTAWQYRENVWTPFLERNNGRFAYSYNERIRRQITRVINELYKHNYTRQAIISIWSIDEDNKKIGIDRVPCSIYYQFLFRDDRLHIVYNMRSCDVYTHYHNDVYLAIKLLHYVSKMCNMPVGNFIMNIGSFHAYNKDIPKEMMY